MILHVAELLGKPRVHGLRDEVPERKPGWGRRGLRLPLFDLLLQPRELIRQPSRLFVIGLLIHEAKQRGGEGAGGLLKLLQQRLQW